LQRHCFTTTMYDACIYTGMWLVSWKTHRRALGRLIARCSLRSIMFLVF
jgi:hypothetical protein